MITIKKSSDKKFYVVVTGDNNEVLSTSETLNSKQAAWKNIRALCAKFNFVFVFVEDNGIRYRVSVGSGAKTEIQDDTKKKK